MRLESNELSELWKRMDSHMQNNHLREELRIASYSERQHRKFFDLITAEPLPDAPPPQQEIIPLLQELYKSLMQVTARAAMAVSGFEKKAERDLGVVRTLFERYPNPEVESLRETHKRNAQPSKDIVRQCQDDMQLIEFVIADPRLQQVQNPALTGHALSF